jgi:hypothetical protein
VFTLFYLQVANAMNIPEVYPNAHITNPYYSNPLRGKPGDMHACIVCGEFCNALADAYRALNARRTADCFIGSVADRIAKEEADYEKQLVRLSPPAIPSQGPPLGFRIDEPPSEVTPKGKVQFLMPAVLLHPAP